MNAALSQIYQASGLSSLGSPWFASLLVFACMAAAVYALVTSLVWLRSASSVPSAILVMVKALVVFLLGAAMLLAVGVEAFIRRDGGVSNDTWFTIYWLSLFALATSPVYWVVKRAGFISSASA